MILVGFEIELTASVLVYEIARIDGIISDDELDILMEEIKKITNKVNKVELEQLKSLRHIQKTVCHFTNLLKI